VWFNAAVFCDEYCDEKCDARGGGDKGGHEEFFYGDDCVSGDSFAAVCEGVWFWIGGDLVVDAGGYDRAGGGIYSFVLWEEVAGYGGMIL